MTTVLHEVDPISRIEGHLGVKLSVTDGFVDGADVHGNLWRGFENFLIGRDPNDAITFTQRICGVCPLPHATASTFAVESVSGYNDNFVTFSDIDHDGKGVPAKAVYIRNLVYAAEFLMSHITHFYHLAAPSYVQGPAIPPWTPYFDDTYYHTALRSADKGAAAAPGALPGNGAAGDGVSDAFSRDVWSAVIKQYVKALRIRRLTFEAGALFAGRMPMVSAFVAGGTTNDTTNTDFQARCDKFETLLKEVGDFIVKEYVPLVLTLGALYPAFDNVNNVSSPYGACLGYGGGYGNFLSWGAFPDPATQTLAIKGGTVIASGSPVLLLEGKSETTFPSTNPASASALVIANLKEHIAKSRYAAYPETGGYNTATDAAYPGNVSRTKPERHVGTKYSWLKAPRWDGHPMEVGPFARLVVNGWYPVSNTTLRSVVPGYGKYVKTASGNTGLDPAMVNPDLAVALVRATLAQVWIGTTHADSAWLVGKTTGEIAAAYNDPNAVIMGTVRDWIYGLKGGLSTMDRLRGRGLEALVLVQAMIGSFTGGAGAGAVAWPTHGGWIGALRDHTAVAPASNLTYSNHAMPTIVKSGFGVSEAPRGALAHFITIDKGKITKYQCVVPTTWNGSPKDFAGVEGPIEKAMLGIPFDPAGAEFTGQDGSTTVSTQGGVEALRVAQSFDPCIACAVH